MKKVLFLALVLSGCDLFEPQYVKLDPNEIAALEAKFGDLASANAEALRAEVQAIKGVPVEEIIKGQEEIIAKLSTPAVTIGGEAVDGGLSGWASGGIGAAIVGALGAGLAAWRKYQPKVKQ